MTTDTKSRAVAEIILHATRDHPVTALSFDPREHGTDAMRLLRFFRREQAKYGVRLCDEWRRSAETKSRYKAFWIERIDNAAK